MDNGELRALCYLNAAQLTSRTEDNTANMGKRSRARIWRLALFCGVVLIACGGEQATDGLRQVPRNRTLIVDCAENNTCGGQIQDYNTFNPFVPGGISRIGYQFLYEPLYFFNGYKADAEPLPWIATGHQFNADYTEVVVDIRPGVEWSDGQPWTAHDFVFTVNMLKEHAPNLVFSTDMETWVQEAVALDSLTAKIVLKSPNPRFLFSYFTHNHGNGVPIVPKHIWEGQDPLRFANYDLASGWPVVTGPYRMALSEPAQRIWDLRPDWWAAKIGFHALPQVERLIFLPYMEEHQRVQNLLANKLDTCLELRPSNIITLLEQHDKMSTWTGREPPYSYMTPWAITLGFNNMEAPFDDPEIRRAINFAINREQLVEIGWQNSGDYALLPLPDVPQMQPYFAAAADLVARYEIGVHDTARTATIMSRKGWARGPDGFWMKDSETFSLVIDIFAHFQDLTPILVAQLQAAGFDASFRMTSDYISRMAQGEARAFMFGNLSSMRDPYQVLSHYHSRFAKPTGETAEHYWRWQNADFDTLVDRMAQTPNDDPAMMAIYRQAIAIWLAELPAIPLVQWPHRIPVNETYWTGWPSAENPYMNTSYWARSWLLVLLNLRPVG